MSKIEKYVQKKLFELQDIEYKNFQSKLMPTVSPDVIIGVRTPILRKFAKEFGKTSDAPVFLKALPHKYYEENNLHALLIENIKDYDEAIKLLDKFLPYVDNWATCDMMTPKILGKNTEKLYDKILVWINSGDTFTVRFAVKMLMTFYLGDNFKTEYLKLVSSIKSDEYYVKMMNAWYFATALAKQYDKVLPYMEKGLPDIWVHNKAIQKAIESYRITDSQKAYLRTLKINKN